MQKKEYNKTIIKLGNFSMECYGRQDDDKQQNKCDIMANDEIKSTIIHR